ncbi:MAG: phospho-sugar mutase [Bacillota bacterium]|nr:phospho-sugar mutase [Bacillota bacterium]
MDYLKKYGEWLKYDKLPEDIKLELTNLKDNENEIKERFGADLSFGTAGLRGVISAGTNCMNIFTVRRATKGLALYIIDAKIENPSVVIGYDSRHKSDEFAKEAANTLSQYGIKVYLFNELRPVPEVSFATRYLKCTAGIMITASHNPSKYNGYKVYGSDGCQIGPEIADIVTDKINNLDLFGESPKPVNESLINMIGEEIEDEFLKAVLSQRINAEASEKAGESFKIVYTPFHGTGYKPVMKAFKAIGLKNVYPVEKQCIPDGDFPTVKSPNPEEKEGFELGIKMAKELDVDLILGTDPDCDRVGIVVKNGEGEYVNFTGNQVGALLCEYILSQRKAKGTMPKNPFVVKTIVTTDIIRDICKNYGVTMFECLTGFKFIGELIKEFDEEGEMSYVFGFEESYGYLAGTHARDKDGVVASMLIAEMAAYYSLNNKTLYDALVDLYNKYGWHQEGILNIVREGLDGAEQIKASITKVRTNAPREIAGFEVIALRDYSLQKRHNFKDGKTEDLKLPKSNVLYFELEGGMWVVMRPSGTEPKLKIYVGTKAESKEKAKELSDNILEDVKSLL